MDLHPEDLIEREMCGDLSPIERERLEVHAQQCAVCRLERLARADFRRDAEGPEAEIDVQRLLAAVAGPLAMRAIPRAASRPRMRHLRFVMVAAAVISVTGFAAAARWSGTRALVAAAVPPSIPVAAPVATAVAPRHRLARASEPPAALLPEQAAPDAVRALPVVSPAALVSAANPVGPVALLTPVGAFRASPKAVAPAAVARAAVEPPSSPVPAVHDAPAVAAVAAAPIAEPAPDSSTIFRRANAAREMGDHARASELYRRLLDDFATSPEARASLPMFGRMLLDDGNASGALRRFDDALRLSGSALREDVMLGRALALQRLARPDDEARAWSALLDAYPSSVHTERARRRLLELGRR